MSHYRPRYRDDSPVDRQQIPFDVKRLQCYFWTYDECSWGDRCRYAHYNTGKVADKPVMKSNGRSVAGRNAASQQPVYRRWQGADGEEFPHALSEASSIHQRHSISKHLPVRERPDTVPHRLSRSRSRSPRKREEKAPKSRRIQTSLPNRERKSAAIKDEQATQKPASNLAIQPDNSQDARNQPVDSRSANGQPTNGRSCTDRITISLDKYDNLKAAIAEAKAELVRQTSSVSTLRKTTIAQADMLAAAGALLEDGCMILAQQGELAMDLSQKMQRGERIGADTITGAWLAANDLLMQADSHANMVASLTGSRRNNYEYTDAVQSNGHPYQQTILCDEK